MEMENFLKVRGICSDTTIGTEGDILLSDLLMDYANQSTDNWIKVSDRLPEIEDAGKLFLVYGNHSIGVRNKKLGDASFEIATLLELDGEVFFSNLARFKTTHWQPLPNAPKN